MQRGDIRHRDPERRGRQRAPHLAGDPLGQLGVAREDAAEQARAQVAAGPVEVAVLLEREPGERDHRRDHLAAGLVELGRVADGEHAAQRPAAAEGLQRDALRAADRLAGDERAARALPAAQHRPRLADHLAECGLLEPAVGGLAVERPRRVDEPDPRAEAVRELAERRRESVGAQRRERDRALGGERPRLAGVRVLGEEVGDEPGDGDERHPVGHLEEREPLPRARVDEGVGGAGPDHLGAEAERGDARVAQAPHVRLGELGLGFAGLGVASNWVPVVSSTWPASRNGVGSARSELCAQAIGAASAPAGRSGAGVSSERASSGRSSRVCTVGCTGAPRGGRATDAATRRLYAMSNRMHLSVHAGAAASVAPDLALAASATVVTLHRSSHDPRRHPGHRRRRTGARPGAPPRHRHPRPALAGAHGAQGRGRRRGRRHHHPRLGGRRRRRRHRRRRRQLAHRPRLRHRRHRRRQREPPRRRGGHRAAQRLHPHLLHRRALRGATSTSPRSSTSSPPATTSSAPPSSTRAPRPSRTR